MLAHVSLNPYARIDFNIFTSTETPIAALPTHLRRAINKSYSRITRSLASFCSCYLCSYCHDADWSVASSVRMSACVFPDDGGSSSAMTKKLRFMIWSIRTYLKRKLNKVIHLITVCIFFSLFFDVLSFLELLSNTAAIFDMLPSVLQDLLLSNFREKLSSFTEALNGGALLQPAAASILFSERTMSVNVPLSVWQSISFSLLFMGGTRARGPISVIVFAVAAFSRAPWIAIILLISLSAPFKELSRCCLISLLNFDLAECPIPTAVRSLGSWTVAKLWIQHATRLLNQGRACQSTFTLSSAPEYSRRV